MIAYSRNFFKENHIFFLVAKHIPFLTTLEKGVITVGIAGKDTFFEVPQKGIFELAPQDRASILLSTKKES